MKCRGSNVANSSERKVIELILLRRKTVGHAPRRVSAVHDQRYNDEDPSLLMVELEGID